MEYLSRTKKEAEAFHKSLLPVFITASLDQTRYQEGNHSDPLQNIESCVSIAQRVYLLLIIGFYYHASVIAIRYCITVEFELLYRIKVFFNGIVKDLFFKNDLLC